MIRILFRSLNFLREFFLPSPVSKICLINNILTAPYLELLGCQTICFTRIQLYQHRVFTHRNAFCCKRSSSLSCLFPSRCPNLIFFSQTYCEHNEDNMLVMEMGMSYRQRSFEIFRIIRLSCTISQHKLFELLCILEAFRRQFGITLVRSFIDRLPCLWK